MGGHQGMGYVEAGYIAVDVSIFSPLLTDNSLVLFSFIFLHHDISVDDIPIGL
jgi:hypothetical protein